MKDIFALERLSENNFLNFSVKFFYYAMLAFGLFSAVWSYRVRGEAQGIFVLLPFMLFWLAAILFILSLRLYTYLKKIETSGLFKRVSNRILWLPLVVFFVSSLLVL